MKNFDTTIYFITDSTGFTESEFLYRVEEACKGGVTLIQLRKRSAQQGSILTLQKSIFREHCQLCLTLEKDADRWIMDMY